MFNTVPPSIVEYLPLDEHFEAAPTELEGLDAAKFDSWYHSGNGGVY